MVTLALLYNKFTQIVTGESTAFPLSSYTYYFPVETVLVIPRHGVQLETHKGLPGRPLFVSRRFIPLPTLQDVVIHEGFRGWNVRYYLAAVKENPVSGFSLDVAFEVGLRHVSCLTEVDYAGRTYFHVWRFF